LCKFEYCGRPVHAKEMCNRHYASKNNEQKKESRKQDYGKNRLSFLLSGGYQRAKQLGCSINPNYVQIQYSPSCYYCGLKVSEFEKQYSKNKAELDHMIPLSRGGAHSLENVVTACHSCNITKQDRTPLEWILDKVNFIKGVGQ